jgi:hypothetical protein
VTLFISRAGRPDDLESTRLAAVTAEPAIADEDLAGGISPTRNAACTGTKCD